MNKRDADMIVVGTGGAGLTAAIHAADEGLKVLQFEKMSQLGGSWHIAQGTSAGAQTKMQFEAGVFDDSPHLFYQDCMKEARARDICHPERLMYYCENAGKIVDWLDSLGAYPKDERFPRWPIYGEPWSKKRVYFSESEATKGAKKYLKALLPEHQKRVERGDIRVLLNTRVKELICEEAGVTGIRVVSDGEVEKTYTAGAVILCSGGFSGNVELLRKYKLPGARQVISLGYEGCTGDGHLMCEQAGARMVNMEVPMLPYLGSIDDPDRPGREIAHVDMKAYPGAIWVDLNGHRVVNEDCGALVPKGRLAMINAPEMTLVVILDQRIREENRSILANWFQTPALSWEWFDEKAEEGVLIQKALSLEALAEKLGLPTAALKDTIERYNRFIADGKDADFDRQNLVYPIEKPPFYAIRTSPSVVATAGGPAINDRQQVLDSTGRIIPGLYSAGEISGWNAHGTGSGNTGCMVFGRLAGRMAAEYVRYRNSKSERT